jgi:hypothetical protein
LLPRNPANVTEFYPFAVHIIYAVIVTISFEIAGNVFIPFNTAFSSYDNILRSTSLLLSYVFIISGWVGYTKSINKRPHTENWLGNTRFVIDLVILFLAFYLLSLTNPDKIDRFIIVFGTFVWLFPITFIVYFIWDMFKLAEYRNVVQEKSTSFSRARKTLYALVLFGFQYLIYVYVIVPYFYDDIQWNNEPVSELILLITSLIIIVLYRNSKWIVTGTSFPRKPRRRRSSVSSKTSSERSSDE